MFQDWSWQCSGCKKWIEPYESHDMEECYRINDVKPYQRPPMTPADRIFAIFFFIGLAAVVAFLVTHT